MPLKLTSSGGGSVTLDVPSTASTFTLNLPAQSGSVVAADANGNLGVGVAAPGFRLDVRDASNTTVHVMGNTSGVRVGASADTPVAGAGFVGTYSNHPLTLGTNNAERMRITNTGNVGIGTTTVNARLTVDGDAGAVTTPFAYFAVSGATPITGYVSGETVSYSIWTSGRINSTEFNARSDGRLKNDVTPIPASDAWHFIQNVMPVHYKWINSPDDGHKFGFIAQDVVKAGFPNLVGQYPDVNVQEVTDADGFTSPAGVMLSVNYDQIVPVLASALRDALSRIETLEARVAALEAN